MIRWLLSLFGPGKPTFGRLPHPIPDPPPKRPPSPQGQEDCPECAQLRRAIESLTKARRASAASERNLLGYVVRLRAVLEMRGAPESPCEACRERFLFGLDCKTCECDCHRRRVAWYEARRKEALEATQ